MTPDVRTDRDAIRAAAAAIRSTAIQDQYAEQHPLLVAGQTVAACWEIIKGESWQDRRS